MSNNNAKPEKKKEAILAIREILEKRTDKKHPLKQEEILDILANEYNIDVERKAVGRTIALIRDNGYLDLVSDKKGTYVVERMFDDSELHNLCDAVMFSKNLDPRSTQDIIRKICSLGGKYYQGPMYLQNAKNIQDMNKTQNREVLLSIGLLDEAIAEKCQVRFTYKKYDINHNLYDVGNYKVSPYAVVQKNRQYYLMCQYVKGGKGELRYFRIDKMFNTRKVENQHADDINRLPIFHNGINFEVISNSLPYMFSDAPKPVTIRIDDEKVADDIFDWFGPKVKFKEDPDHPGMYLATIKVSPMAMHYWALQYIDHVEVVHPSDVRDEIKKSLQKALNK